MANVYGAEDDHLIAELLSLYAQSEDKASIFGMLLYLLEIERIQAESHALHVLAAE